MKKNIKKAFTLIELLAIIIIIGLIALITIPKINTTVKDSKKNIYESSAAALEREADIFYAHKKMNQGGFDGCEYNFETENNTCEGFEFKGKKPDSGVLKVYSNGDIAYSVQFNNYCYSKKPKSDTIVESPDCSKILLETPQTVTTGDGLYESTIEPGRLVYRGANPNNYIILKENGIGVTYRIISFENDGTIKVVRNEKLSTDMAWDEHDSSDITTGPRDNLDNTFCLYGGEYHGCNVWGNSSNTFYNGSSLGSTYGSVYYENNNTTELIVPPAPYPGTVTVDSTLNQYLNNTWIADKEISKYIDNHDFNVGGVFYHPSYTGEGAGLQNEKANEKIYTWNGKIGLMNITDYVESSTNSACIDVWSNSHSNPNNTTNKTSNEWPCKYENYNYKSDYHQWSLSRYPGFKNYVWYMNSAGYFIQNGNASDTIGVRPAFYLKSSVILTGSGTESNPYRIVE